MERLWVEHSNRHNACSMAEQNRRLRLCSHLGFKLWIVPIAATCEGECWLKDVVVVVITRLFPRHGDVARTAIQVHAINLIEIRLGERWQPISNQSLVTIATPPTTMAAICGYPRVALCDMLGEHLNNCNPVKYG